MRRRKRNSFIFAIFFSPQKIKKYFNTGSFFPIYLPHPAHTHCSYNCHSWSSKKKVDPLFGCVLVWLFSFWHYEITGRSQRRPGLPVASWKHRGCSSRGGSGAREKIGRGKMALDGGREKAFVSFQRKALVWGAAWWKNQLRWCGWCGKVTEEYVVEWVEVVLKDLIHVRVYNVYEGKIKRHQSGLNVTVSEKWYL